MEQLKSAKVGDAVFFGSYEQDDDLQNGEEDIEWIVLDIQDGKVLLISRYSLSWQRYNNDDTIVTWETCTLREWLNNDFMNFAFSDTEKNIISVVKVSADKNPDYDTNPGNDTYDKVFLLSVSEAKKYFSPSNSYLRHHLKCQGTRVVNKSLGIYVNSSYWWLRTHGQTESSAAYVCYEIASHGTAAYTKSFDMACGVRPALWIDLSFQ